MEILDFFGSLFLNALKMIVVPLILSSIIVGVRNMASQNAFGRIGGKTVPFTWLRDCCRFALASFA